MARALILIEYANQGTAVVPKSWMPTTVPEKVRNRLPRMLNTANAKYTCTRIYDLETGECIYGNPDDSI